MHEFLFWTAMACNVLVLNIQWITNFMYENFIFNNLIDYFSLVHLIIQIKLNI